MKRLFLIAAVAACGDAPAGTYTIDTLPSGAVHVVNTAPAMWADTNGWKIVLDREIPLGPGTPGELEMPGWTTMDDAGRVYVVERSPIGIKVFDVDGSYLGSIGREGGGPGEFRSPTLLIHRDTLITFDEDLKRISLYSRAGELLSEWIPPCCSHGLSGLDSLGRFGLEYGWAGDSIDARYFLRFQLDGTQVDSIPHPPEPTQRQWTRIVNGGGFSYTIPYQPRGRLLFLQSGGLLSGTTDRLRLVWSTGAHDTLRVAEVALSSATIPDSVRRASVEDRYVQQAFAGIAKVDDVPTSYPVWGFFEEDGQGNVWVSHRSPDGSVRFVVLAPDGRHLGDVPHWFSEEYIQTLRGDYMVTVEQDDEGAFSIRRYRINREIR